MESRASSGNGVPGLLREAGAVAGCWGMGSWRGLKGKLLLKGVVMLAGLGCCCPAEDEEVVAVAELPLAQDIPAGFKVVATGLSTGEG